MSVADEFMGMVTIIPVREDWSASAWVRWFLRCYYHPFGIPAPTISDHWAQLFLWLLDFRLKPRVPLIKGCDRPRPRPKKTFPFERRQGCGTGQYFTVHYIHHIDLPWSFLSRLSALISRMPKYHINTIYQIFPLPPGRKGDVITSLVEQGPQRSYGQQGTYLNSEGYILAPPILFLHTTGQQRKDLWWSEAAQRSTEDPWSLSAPLTPSSQCCRLTMLWPAAYRIPFPSWSKCCRSSMRTVIIYNTAYMRSRRHGKWKKRVNRSHYPWSQLIETGEAQDAKHVFSGI